MREEKALARQPSGPISLRVPASGLGMPIANPAGTEETLQIPTPRTPVSKCVALGLYSQAMLGLFPANPTLAALSTTLGSATSALTAAQGAYAEAVLVLIAPRVLVRFADYSSDIAVRASQRAAETADGVKGGKIGGAVFPNGVTPIVRPVGATQVTEMRALEGRLEAAMALWPGAGPEKVKITDERTKYEAALAARRTAMEKAADLRAKRDAVKEDFLDVYAVSASRVKAEFPRNRAMQDLFFDKVSDAVVVEETSDEPDAADEAAGDDAAAPANTAPASPA